MPEKILGLDIGSGSVKAVLLLRGLRGGGSIAGIRRIGIAESGGIPGALQQLFSDKVFEGAVCVSSICASQISFRNIRLPFRDSKKIKQTIAFAVEPLIQQPVESVLIDYTFVERLKQTELFTAIAERTMIGERKNLLSQYVRETAVIDVDAVPLASLLSQKPDFPSCAVILNIGFEVSTAVFAGRGCISHIRHFYFGGRKAAEDVSTAPGSGIDADGRAERKSELKRFFLELKNTISSLLYGGRIPEFPSKIILTGGGAGVPGMAEELAGYFSVAVEKTDLLSSGGFGIDPGLRSSWNPAVMDQALAMAARSLGKGTGFNFLKREREDKSDSGELGGLMKKAAAVVGIILIMAGIELGLRDYGMRLRLGLLKDKVLSEFKRIDPETTRIVDPVAQIKGKIAEAKKLTAGIGDTSSSTKALVVLREISAAAPPEILLNSLLLDGDAVVLKGEAPSFDLIDAFKKKLADPIRVKTVTFGSTSLIKEGKGVEFNLKVILKR